MKRTDLADVAHLVEQAGELYSGDPVATGILDGYARRLRDPLRLAVAGMVKAGKSTMLNALIGEQIAPTDAGECTRIVTWYRHGHTPRITVHLREGEPLGLPIRRTRGALVIELGAVTAEEVDWIDVQWPSESLRSTVLIDTPGMASLSADVSARSLRFLNPEDASSEADAILYLLRHIHASDVKFLEAFHDTAAGASQTVNAVAVLSRADEVGSGRIDSLLSAARIADRYRRDGELRALALGCIPVAGLLAEGARTLREDEFAAFRHLAGLERTIRDRMLISVDRFTRPTPDTTLSAKERSALLARFGIFGVRLGAALVRGGVRTSSELSERMVAQSGLIELQQFVAEQFRARAIALKARGVLHGLDRFLAENSREGAAAIRAGIERVHAGSHDLRELSFLAAARSSIPALPVDALAEAERIVGGAGTAALTRLGLADDSPRDEVAARIDELLARWRSFSESPLSDRRTVDLCRVVIRSVEGVASEVAAGAPFRPAPDVVLTSGPLQSGGQHAEQ